MGKVTARASNVTTKRDYELKDNKWSVSPKQKVEIELEGVFHLKALLQDPEVREEIQSIIKEWVEDGGITANIDTT